MGYDLQSRLGTVSLGGVSATYQYQPGGTTVTGVNRPLSAVVGAPAGVTEGSLSRDAVGRVRFSGVASASGSLSPTNDDGNLTFVGRWHYEWDGESSRGTEARWTDDKVGCPEGVRARAERPNQNRLIGMEEAASHSISGTGVSSGFARANRLEFAYDALGRRVRKKVLDAPRDAQGVRSGAWVLKKETVFVWQDWRMLAEYVKTPEITTLQLRRSYLWGMDLVSGVYQAGMAENAAALSHAGGVGGLLWVVDYLPGQSTSNRQLAPWYDGNGNILGWVENELAQVQPLHRLEYDAFGRLLVDDPVRVALTKKQNDLGATEAWLDRPAFGFSTKYEDGETGLLYYGHRYYAPEVGRWPSRDPIEEQGGINLYGMVGNDPVNFVDFLGLNKSYVQTFTKLLRDQKIRREIKRAGTHASLESLRRTRAQPPPQRKKRDQYGRSSLEFDENDWAAQNEWGGIICLSCDGKLWVHRPIEGVGATVDIKHLKCPDDGRVWMRIGLYHSHPMSQSFSSKQPHDPRPGDLGQMMFFANKNMHDVGVYSSIAYVAYSKSIRNKADRETAIVDEWVWQAPRWTNVGTFGLGAKP